MVRLEIDAAQVIGRVDDAARRVMHLGPAHEAAAMQLRGGIMRNFRRGGFYPEPWAESRAATARGGKTLVERGTLRNSIHTSHTEEYGAAGTDVVYAAIHQFGGDTGKNHATHLPARPFLPADDAGVMEPAMAARIRRIYGNYIVEGRAR